MVIDSPTLVYLILVGFITTAFGFLLFLLEKGYERYITKRQEEEEERKAIRRELYGGKDLPPANIKSAVELAKRSVEESIKYFKEIPLSIVIAFIAFFIFTTFGIYFGFLAIPQSPATSTPTLPNPTNTPVTSTPFSTSTQYSTRIVTATSLPTKTPLLPSSTNTTSQVYDKGSSVL